MENREHFEARAAFEHAAEANNQVAALVRWKYQHEALLRDAEFKATAWQTIAIATLAMGFIYILVTLL